MLIDKNCIIVLVALNKALTNVGYEIIEKAEFLSGLEIEMSAKDLSLALVEIVSGGYLKMKFNDKDEFCAAMTETGRQSVDKLEKLRIKELSAKAVVGKSASGQMVITTLDDSPIYDTPSAVDTATDAAIETKVTDNLPASIEVKKRKSPGRIATFFYGTFGGLFGSGIVVSIMCLLAHLGIIV